MILPSQLLSDTVQLAANQRVLILNSAADPFVPMAAQQIKSGEIILAEDNIANLGRNELGLYGRDKSGTYGHDKSGLYRHIAFHEYILREPPATMDVAVMNMLYQPSNAWMLYGLQLARYALKVGGRLYVVGAKDRGVLSMAKRMEEQFGNVETLAIHKGHRVLCSRQFDRGPWHPQGAPLHFPSDHQSVGLENPQDVPMNWHSTALPLADARAAGPLEAAGIPALLIPTFAAGKMDEGTRLLLEVLEVRTTDEALDIGCGAGFIGIYIARRATKGHVTMVDASLVAVAMAKQAIEQSGLTNVQVLPSDGVQAVLSERFDLVVTNPPFHVGGIQTTEIAERFIREAAQVLRPRGRFYLVANRFLKYEPTLQTCFRTVEEVGGDRRYKVLRALQPMNNSI